MDPATKESEAELSQGSVVGGFVLGRKLGEGEMGEVYLATGPGADEVALKILRVPAIGRGVELEARFRREVALCASLRHPNIVSVIDHGVHRGLPYYVMPLLRGGDLDAWLTTTGPLRPEVATAITLQACAGLRAAHEAGIVHRDLKPANIFLDERSDGEVVAVVCDFGVAKVRDEDGSLTASGAVLGTPMYMAPEQLLDSKRVDARCDVWALGMVLYAALTGKPAFVAAKTIGDLILLLNGGVVPPIQERAPWVPPGLARVVHASLLPLDRRIASVRDLENALLRGAAAGARLTRADLAPMPDDARSAVATRASLPADATELSGEGVDTVLGDLPEDAPVADAQIGRTLADRYRIVAKIGSGGMGAVYEAVDTSATGAARNVAVKVMQHENGPRGVETTRRFLREAKASARIASPHVTRFLDSGVDAASGAPFIVMERLRGRDLATQLASSGALEASAVVALFIQACGALGAAHALGIVHRDMKPSNLFLHEEGEAITLKVCDFGIAKQLVREGAADEASTELTRSGGLIGSPLYMSPEQAKSSKNVDERTDIFSLALTMHEALSGERPWRGRTSMGEIIVAVCTEDVPLLAECAPWVEEKLSNVVAKALSRNPAERYASMGELADALRPFAMTRELTAADLVGIGSVVRVQRSPLSSSRAQTGDSVAAKGKSTADPVSVTSGDSVPAPARRRRMMALVAVAALALGGAGAFGVLRSKDNHVVAGGGATPSAPPSSPIAAPPATTSASAAPPPSASSDVPPSPSGSASPSAAVLVQKPLRPNLRVDAGRAATAATVTTTPSATSTASVGRGFTATDLPSAPK